MLPLNGIRHDKVFILVATVRVHPDKYEKDFDAVVTFLTSCIDKRTPTPSVNVTSVVTPDLSSGRRPVLTMTLSRERLS